MSRILSQSQVSDNKGFWPFSRQLAYSLSWNDGKCKCSIHYIWSKSFYANLAKPLYNKISKNSSQTFRKKKTSQNERVKNPHTENGVHGEQAVLVVERERWAPRTRYTHSSSVTAFQPPASVLYQVHANHLTTNRVPSIRLDSSRESVVLFWVHRISSQRQTFVLSEWRLFRPN